jgi:hypothetical protein
MLRKYKYGAHVYNARVVVILKFCDIKEHVTEIAQQKFERKFM